MKENVCTEGFIVDNEDASLTRCVQNGMGWRGGVRMGVPCMCKCVSEHARMSIGGHSC